MQSRSSSLRFSSGVKEWSLHHLQFPFAKEAFKQWEMRFTRYMPGAPFIFMMTFICLFQCRILAADDFEPLFNHVDLSGWIQVNGAPETFSVRDSMIVCSGIPRSMLRTSRQYENFIIEMEWLHLYAGGNAGLFVHADPLPAP